jgi:hypothetical protein
MLVMRSLLERLDRFDERLMIGEDTDLLFRLTFVTRFCVVGKPLVRIDRTRGREPGLIELFDRSDDEVFDCLEYRYIKWLALPKLEDPDVRNEIQIYLRATYYDWTIAKLYEFKLRDAFGRSLRIHQAGDSYPKIVAVLAQRTARKLVCTLHGWWKELRGD